jgi:hypothetical protein
LSRKQHTPSNFDLKHLEFIIFQIRDLESDEEYLWNYDHAGSFRINSPKRNSGSLSEILPS